MTATIIPIKRPITNCSRCNTWITDGQSTATITMAKRTESVVVGVNRAGYLVSPTSGNIGMALPAVIPDGAVVAVN